MEWLITLGCFLAGVAILPFAGYFGWVHPYTNGGSYKPIIALGAGAIISLIGFSILLFFAWVEWPRD